MVKKLSVQMLGNYLEPLTELLRDKGILTESIISGCNFLAMAGEEDKSYMHYCDNAGMQTLLNIKKNLAQMLSHDPQKFTQNFSKQPTGVEVRYANTTDYLIVSNSALAYNIFKKGEKIYSGIWPRNAFIEEIEASYEELKFPFPDDFNWKFYYDKFIDVILNEYDQNHIILIKTNSADWYMDKEDIFLFDDNSAKFRRRIEEFDNYFIERTNCFQISSQYCFIPEGKWKGAFPYACMGRASYEYITKCVEEIVQGGGEKYRCFANMNGNRFYNDLLSKLSIDIAIEYEHVMEEIRNHIYSLDKLGTNGEVEKKLFEELIQVRKCIEQGYTLTDYYRDFLQQETLQLDLNFLLLYSELMRITINDIIALYELYNLCDEKKSFRSIVRNVLKNRSCLPVLMAQELYDTNICFLDKYPYIQKEMVDAAKGENKSSSLVYLGNDCFLELCADCEKPIKKVIVRRTKTYDRIKIVENGYVCTFAQAEALCADLAFYIEKAKRGEGDAPISLKFEDTEEFIRACRTINFQQLLELEHFVLCLKDSCFKAGNCKARTNLEFLFRKGTMIYHISSGMTDQMCYYLASKRSQEVRGGEIYYDDIPIVKGYYFSGMSGLNSIIKEDIRERLFSHLFNRRLVDVLKRAVKTPDLLFKCGCNNLMVVSCEKARMGGVESCNRLLYTNADSLKDYFEYEFPVTYYLSLIRPEHIMKYSDFDPKKYIEFPEYDTEVNKNIAQKMNSCDSVAIHIRRGDLVIEGVVADMDFYKESLLKLKNIPDYPNKKFFIFSDNIPWCKENLEEIGFDCFPDADITFVDNNKGADSYRDMQLMTEAKIHIGGCSGFARMVPILSKKCEVYMQYNLPVMEFYKKAGIVNKYDIGEYSKPYRVNWGVSNNTDSTVKK